MCLSITEKSVGHVCRRPSFAAEEQYGSGDSASFRPSSSVLDYSHPCLGEFAGNINCTEFIATTNNIINVYVGINELADLIKLYILLHLTYCIIITLY